MKKILFILILSLICNNLYAASKSFEQLTATIEKQFAKPVIYSAEYASLMVQYDSVHQWKDLNSIYKVLADNDFTALNQGSYVHIIPMKSVRTMPLPPLQKAEFDYQVTFTIINLGAVCAATLIPVIRPLIHKDGHVAALTKMTNTIIATGEKWRLLRLKEIINNIESDIGGEAGCDGGMQEGQEKMYSNWRKKIKKLVKSDREA